MSSARHLNLGNTDFGVVLRVLYDARGTLLVLSPEQTRLKYTDLRDDYRVRFADLPDTERAKQNTRLDVAEAQELELFAELTRQRGEECAVHVFTFRVPNLGDYEAAEQEASKGDARSELTFRRGLAGRTLVATDYPDFKDFGTLRTDVALYVLAEVSQRVVIRQDVRDFLQREAVASDAASASQPN